MTPIRDTQTQDQCERGSATVEFALALPAAVLMLGAVLAMVAWSHVSLRAHNAAAVSARVAITNTDGEALDAGHQVAGEQVELELARSAGWVTVRAHVPARGLMPGSTAVATVPEQP